ncbi:tRNA (cmo5U34)-methyltransferase [Candidatus Photodesmus blepharus]|uniref:Carboxy-S-adenosyl-L-methionine synthase n=1 Tax=Candidatus Photodesmus blepharonis TaxID=1179155 RepID=A0A084CP93_9GAMM|nr:carboxy-S-adenosyl-L-methionine synthase CmoA [Candidatus Photodesmus blepharus]KEY91622.1 tRNA (cmo5U34)-methyltransferase [Candidatus Photodesmus blepharus]
MKNNRDTIFSTQIDKISHFAFEENIVKVFPDMIERSIPGYNNILSTIGMLAKRFVKPHSKIYDLGCSLGAATLSICRSIDQKGCCIIAVDNSKSMVKHCKFRLKASQSDVPVKVLKKDIRNIEITNASFVVLNFTLQFLAPEDRYSLLKKIYSGLCFGGMVILSEKYTFEDTVSHGILTELHHNFKRSNGYSELEINQKKSAIKNVMRPDSIQIHKARFKNIGFSSSEVWFQYFNFGSIFAIK